METEPKTASDVRSRPDWTRIEGDIVCPLCEYNLRGLVEPRCPECGHPFDWAEILDPSRRRHFFLFEHHPERRFWSFGQTLWGGLSPRRFWRSLDPRQPSYPRRLRLYWYLVVALYVVVIITPIAGLAVLDVGRIITSSLGIRPWLKVDLNRSAQTNPKYYQWVLRTYGSVEAYLDDRAPVSWGAPLMRRLLADVLGFFVQNWHVPIFLLAPLVWPWLVLPVSCWFALPRARPALGPPHMRRCLIYSFDGLPWAGLVLIALTVVSLIQRRFDVTAAADQMAWLTPLAIIAYLGFSVVRLGMAFRLHLKLEHGFAHAVGVHVITMLALATVAVALGYAFLWF